MRKLLSHQNPSQQDADVWLRRWTTWDLDWLQQNNNRWAQEKSALSDNVIIVKVSGITDITRHHVTCHMSSSPCRLFVRSRHPLGWSSGSCWMLNWRVLRCPLRSFCTTDGVSATFCRFSTSKLIKSMLTNYDKLTATNSNGLSLCLEEFTWIYSITVWENRLRCVSVCQKLWHRCVSPQSRSGVSNVFSMLLFLYGQCSLPLETSLL